MKSLLTALALFGAIFVGQQFSAAQELTPVALEDGVAKINAENTAIQFVGTHVGDDPKPRLGGFKEFSGMIKINPEDNSIESMNLEIDINSLWTQFDKLTAHLKNADFFEVEEYGTAKFESTGVEVDQLGNTNVVGNLTLHGTSKEIRFPVEATVNDDGISLRSEFKINRALFGMDKMTSGVEKVVSLTFVVGHQTVVVAEGDDNPLKTHQESPDEKPQVDPNATEVTLKLPNMS